jgi:hypothetical protein
LVAIAGEPGCVENDTWFDARRNEIAARGGCLKHKGTVATVKQAAPNAGESPDQNGEEIV